MIKVKRLYEPSEPSDGYRILVDRLWPRGIKKNELNADLWLKEVAPSNELRKWFDHDPAKWTAFNKKYKEELNRSGALLELIGLIKQHKNKVTLLYSGKDEQHTHALVLKTMLEKASA